MAEKTQWDGGFSSFAANCLHDPERRYAHENYRKIDQGHSESPDGGRSFSAPRPLLADQGGSPPHLLRLSDGTLISTYGYRQPPSDIKVMVSRDTGHTWDTDHDL